MKRILSIVVALAALLGQAAIAQEAGEPDEESVLEAARSKYFAQDESPDSAPREAPEAPDAASEEADEGGPASLDRQGGERPFAPFVISFAPGLSTPFGIYDTSLSLAAIGAITGKIDGFQAAGVFNIAQGGIAGFQAAGVFNMAQGGVEGFQGAGVFNMAQGGVEGFQGAGVFNMAQGKVEGCQLAGVFNISGDADLPVQAAGVFNIAQDLDGFQVSGVFNVARRVDGGQVAAIVNIADRVDGVQVGLVNIADRVDGLQLGIVNIARKSGIGSEGAFYEPETDYAYAALQAGSRHFYTLLSAGMPAGDWFSSAEGLVASYGLGARLRLSPAYIDVDLSAASVLGPELPAIGRMMGNCEPLGGEAASSLIPYPSLRFCLGLPVVGRLHLVGGLKADFDLDAAPRVPEALKRGRSYRSELFGVEYTAWAKWYVGVKI